MPIDEQQLRIQAMALALSVNSTHAPSRPSMALPEQFRSALFVQDGEFWTCTLQGFSCMGTGTSRSKPRALSFALEDLAKKVLQETE